VQSQQTPLRVGITELRRRPGTQRDVEVALPLSGLSITGARVPDDADLVVDVTLESVEGTAVTAVGTVQVPWAAECRRCLDDVEGVLSVDVHEVFEVRPTDGETYPIEGDEVDLEPIVRDAALLHLPLAALCRPDCPGPAPDAFPTVAAGEVDGPTEAPMDPRWAALDELRLDPDPPG
jgi:uncharacterized protein